VLAEWRRAQQLGFLGPGPVEDHLRHALGFREAVPPPDLALDLGSGAGVPGLALAQWWPASRSVLLDGSERRTVFLHDAVEKLGLADRVTVVHSPAEVAARDVRRRGGFDLVVARSFGPPPVVAECGAPFLSVGGRLVVSEPPESDADRWPAEGLAQLGLELDAPRQAGAAGFVVLLQRSAAPDDVPRRAGIPGRRPRW